MTVTFGPPYSPWRSLKSGIFIATVPFPTPSQHASSISKLAISTRSNAQSTTSTLSQTTNHTSPCHTAGVTLIISPLSSATFTRANKVVIDLGHADQNTGLAIDLMRKMSSLSPDQIGPNLILRPDFERLGLPGLDDPAWQAWMDLLTREWFNRVWMVQEFALASHFEMMIGPYIFDGSLIEKAHPISARLQPPTDALLQSV